MNIILCSISAIQNPKESARITLFLKAKELIQQGHNVIITAPWRKGLAEKEIVEHIPLYRYSSRATLPLTIRKIQQEQGWKADRLHGFSAAPLFILPLFWSRLTAPKAKIILSLKSYSRSWWGRRGSSLLRLADRITVPTHAHARTWGIRHYELLRSPIDTTKFQPQDKQKLKKKYGLEKHKIILYYGALWEHKGIHELIKALPLIIQKEKKALLLILPRYANIKLQEELVRQLNLENYVRFITKDVAIEEYVNLADVVALPYRNLIGTEGNPSCLLEALACNTPVVTSDLPELREIAERKVVFSEPNSPESVAEKILEIITSQN